MKTISYTKDGYDDLLKRKAALEFDRIDAVKEVTRASELGDRSENAAYKYGKQKLRQIDSQLKFINNQLRFAHVVEPRNDGIVGIGSKVIVEAERGEQEFIIGGGYESDLSKGRISQYSPLGKAIFGKKVGDICHMNVPAGRLQYKIIKIY